MLMFPNRFGDTVGIISVEDKDGIEDIEDVDVMISNEYGDVVDVVTLTDDYIPDDKDDYLESETLETVKNFPNCRYRWWSAWGGYYL